MQRQDIGEMYRLLRQLGLRDYNVPNTKATTIPAETFKAHFQEVQKQRNENDLKEMIQARKWIRKYAKTSTTGEREAEELSETPTPEEIIAQCEKVKEKAPGDDEVRMIYMKNAPEDFQERIIKVIQVMFETPAEHWDEIVKVGIIVPLHKKGAKDNPDNFRGVCLLSMVSRILARVLTSRLRDWSEKHGALDDNQDGFRQNRSTADAAQIAIRLHEDNRRVAGEQRDKACLLDLRKAYPRVNRPLLWRILESYGFKGNFLERLKDLHEVTAYKVRSGKETSSEWIPLRGLREGCPSSPILFNLFHQVAMRVAEEVRPPEDGIEVSYIPGNACQTQRRDQKNSEARRVRLKNILFADDTTILSQATNMEAAKQTTKEVMKLFEEKINDSKEENVTLGEPSAAGTRVLGIWPGEKEDTNARVRRGMGAWAKVKRRLKHSRLTKRTQARVVEAVVESSMLYNCHIRTWTLGEIARMQKKVDRCYRYVWSSKNQPPLKEMEKKRKNMWNVRKEMRVKTMRMKVEKRSLERMGHVLRLPEDRRTRQVTFGWLSTLETEKKEKKRYRCTPRYWLKLAKEAGWDATRVEDEAKDRKKWRAMIRDRIHHIERWEETQENGWDGELLKRSEYDPESATTICAECNRKFISRAGLAIHIKRMHRIQRDDYECSGCGDRFSQKANLKNHMKKCNVETSPTKYSGSYKECPSCKKMLSATNMSRHLASCTGRRGGTL